MIRIDPFAAWLMVGLLGLIAITWVIVQRWLNRQKSKYGTMSTDAIRRHTIPEESEYLEDA
jgi:hypothetical protein